MTNNYQILYRKPLTNSFDSVISVFSGFSSLLIYISYPITWRDGVFPLTWTDSTPLTSGSRIAFRTQNSSVRFDNIRATTTSSSLYYFFTDHPSAGSGQVLGSTSVLSDSSGNEVAGSRTRHLPFGGWRGPAPTQTVTDRAFTGQKENMEVGLLYFNARYYLPSSGRFISADTIVPSPANPQSFNRYSYVGNHPINYNDPTGHCGADIINLPNGSQVTDQDLYNQCTDLRNFLEGYYGVNIYGKWKFWELSAFAHGLFDMKEGLGGIDYFKAIFSGIDIYRESQWAESSSESGKRGNFATANIGEPIFFYDAAFQSFDKGRWATIHEFGHIFDQANQFVTLHPDHRWAGWVRAYNAIVEGNSLQYSPDFIYPKALDEMASSYAMKNTQEDYAESWTAYHFKGSWNAIGAETNWWGARQPPSQERLDHIANDIAAFQLTVIVR